MIASNQLDLPGSGPLGILVFAAVAGSKLREHTKITHSIISKCSVLWSFLSILLFSLIGSDISIENIDTNILLMIFVVILIGLIVRMIKTYGCLIGGGLNMKEKLFITVAWISKAAVQAAVGPAALAVARTRCGDNCDTDSDVYRAKVILTTSVIAVLICAPLGSIGMAYGGPRLLSQPLPVTKETDDVGIYSIGIHEVKKESVTDLQV